MYKSKANGTVFRVTDLEHFINKDAIIEEYEYVGTLPECVDVVSDEVNGIQTLRVHEKTPLSFEEWADIGRFLTKTSIVNLSIHGLIYSNVQPLFYCLNKPMNKVSLVSVISLPQETYPIVTFVHKPAIVIDEDGFDGKPWTMIDCIGESEKRLIRNHRFEVPTEEVKSSTELNLIYESGWYIGHEDQSVYLVGDIVKFVYRNHPQMLAMMLLTDD